MCLYNLFGRIMKHILSILLCLFCISCANKVEFICNDKDKNCIDCAGLKPQQYTFKDRDGNEMQNCTYFVCEQNEDGTYQLNQQPILGASCDLDGNNGSLHGVCELVDEKVTCIEVK